MNSVRSRLRKARFYLGSSLLFLPVLALADIEIGDAVALGDNLATLESKLAGYCVATAVSSVAPPRFPLAEISEQHLVCEGYTRNEITFETAIFTLADNQLARMEATGINTNDSPEESSTTELPELINFTASLDAQMGSIEESCDPMEVLVEDEIWLKNSPARQVQVNCFNFDYAGFERKLELVFGDGMLQVVWVLTAKPEEQRIRALLIEEWGRPGIANEIWEVFGGGRISLRKDTPELLILSDEMIPLYREEFRE